MNINVEMTDERGQRLAYEQHSLLNNFTVVQREVRLTSSTLRGRAFCGVTVVNMSLISKTLNITIYRVLGKLCKHITIGRLLFVIFAVKLFCCFC